MGHVNPWNNQCMHGCPKEQGKCTRCSLRDKLATDFEHMMSCTKNGCVHCEPEKGAANGKCGS